MIARYNFSNTTEVRHGIQRDINAMTFLNLITQRLLTTKGDNVFDVKGWRIHLVAGPDFDRCTIYLAYQYDWDDETTAIEWVFEKKYDSFVLNDEFDVYLSTWYDSVRGNDTGEVLHQKTFQYVGPDFVYYIAKHTKAYFTQMGWD